MLNEGGLSSWEPVGGSKREKNPTSPIKSPTLEEFNSASRSEWPKESCFEEGRILGDSGKAAKFD